MSNSYKLLWLFIILALSGCILTEVNGLSKTTSNPVELTSTALQIQATQAESHSLTVFAAASLTGAFRELGKDYEQANPRIQIRFNFAGSQTLRTQLEQGASADIFASADHNNMDKLAADKLLFADTYQDFVTNQMVVILPSGNPGEVETLADLAKPNLKLVLADSAVPAGNYARQILVKIGTDTQSDPDYYDKVMANVVSNETDVKQVVTKVELGEADAGIVYWSDTVAATDLLTISIPARLNVIAQYPIAVLANAPDPKQAEAFISYIESPAGQAVLLQWGFNPTNR